jgi:sugar-specific transcriptional regulator TrmB
MLDEKTIETLKALGLTQLQAKLYLSLTKMGSATIKAAATTADIARQDVYRLMDSLLKLGLAEKIVQNPTMYKATPLKEGVDLLFGNKKKEYLSLHKDTLEIVKKLSTTDNFLTYQKQEETFVITNSKKLVLKRLKEQDKSTQERLDAIAEWKRMRNKFYDCFEDYCELLNRGVRIRIITEKHGEEPALIEKMKILQSNPLFEIRYLSTPAPGNMVIYDEKAVQLCISPYEDNFQDLGSKNPHFMKIITIFFEETWKKAETVNQVK